MINLCKITYSLGQYCENINPASSIFAGFIDL